MKFNKEVMPVKVTRHNFKSHSFNHFKMLGIQPSKVVEKLVQSTWKYEVLYTDTDSENEQLFLIRPL
jgi:hypothetical protein